MDLNKKLEELKPYQLNCNIFDVYSYNGLTMQDLLCQFFTKINECITVSNETIDLAKWLVNEGLEIEVVKKLMIWLEDGTLENIINVNLFNTLNEKISGLSSQLEHNANDLINVKNVINERLNDISVSQINKNKGKIDSTYLSDELLNQITGNTPISGVIADKSITSIKIAEKAITSDKMSTELLNNTYSLTKSKKIRGEILFSSEQFNLYNKNDITSGFFLINGVPTSSASNNGYTDYIKVEPNAVLYMTRILTTDGGACYDNNLKYVGKILPDSGSENLFTVPSDVSYIRVNISNYVGYSNFVICLNSKKDFSTNSSAYGYIDGLRVKASEIDEDIFIEQLGDFKKSNLYNNEQATENKYVSNTGVVGDSSIINLSRYIRVNEGDSIGCNYKYDVQGAMYDNEKNFVKKIELSGTDWFTTIIPKNVKYIRVNVVKNDLNDYMIAKSSTKLSYKKYGLNETSRLRDKKILCIGDSITWLDGNTTPNYDNGNTVVVGYQQSFRDFGAIVTNKGHSGATIRKYHSSDDIEHGSLVDDIKNSSYDVSGYDIITIFAGTNDVGRGLRIGELGNESDSNFDETTTIGALRSMIEYIKKNNPLCELYIITPLRSTLATRPYNSMESITEAIISVAKMYSLEVINLLHESGFNKTNMNAVTYDGLHPNNKGFNIIGTKLVKHIK